MSKKDIILDLLAQKRLTVKEIAEILPNDDENKVRVYINRLKKEGKIKLDGKTEDRFKIYKAVDIQDNLEKVVENIDTQILIKMIPKFIEFGIQLNTTTELEDKRIMELIQKCQ